MNFGKLSSKYSNYHYCIVRECKNTSLKTPDKLWIKVPEEKNIRNKWLKLAKRDPLTLSTETQFYLCEDHFDLENDMENYMRYKIMGSVKRIRMKPGCMPSKFECISGGKRKVSSTPDELQHPIKKRAVLVQKNEELAIEMPTSPLQKNIDKENTVPSCSLSLQHKFLNKAVQVVQHNSEFCDQATQVLPTFQHVSCQAVHHYADKVTQAYIRKNFRSKKVQFRTPVKDAVSSPIKNVVYQSIATSPIKPLEGRRIKPSVSGNSLSKRKLSFFTADDSDVSYYTPSQGGSSMDSSPSKPSSQSTVDILQEKIIKEKQINLQSTLSKIKLKPRLYIGIPTELYFIINLISKHTKIPEKYILICLMKIRLNRTFSQLADDFGISLSQASKIFFNKIPSIVSVLSPFIMTFTRNSIKRNLPMAFRYKYNKVNCIIDCLEIEIQKPKKAIHQALTWSEYKKANTYKYLIACTPDGLVSFVSAGYGGRVSDVNLLEHSKFLDSLEPRSCVLADRGFKHIEKYLKQRGFTLLRPPSVDVGSKLTKSEVKQTKEIASLRIHVERVIRRIREFSLLKPHSVVNLNLLCLLDLCVITACALINLQDSLIK